MFAAKHIVVGILLAVVALWVAGSILGFFEKATGVKVARPHETAHKTKAESANEQAKTAEPETLKEKIEYKKGTAGYIMRNDFPVETVHKKPAVKAPVYPGASPEVEAAKAKISRPKGVVFIEALVQPLTYELHQRFWGWRPNDILNFTDNVNNFQQGVLEVTRRTAVILAERISRTGSTAAFDPNLERAMNCFMIKSDRYWFPSAESKYSDGIKELKIYREKLVKGAAKFYTRTDNLIPLLAAYEDLLGSCDENLIKDKEDNGTPVSFFKADDYFFYAKGVASAMHTILGAILEDFHTTIDSRRGLELLHRAIESCHHAVEIDPLIVTNSNLSGVLANHRANMAAPISHARFCLEVLIKTLST